MIREQLFAEHGFRPPADVFAALRTLSTQSLPTLQPFTAAILSAKDTFDGFKAVRSIADKCRERLKDLVSFVLVALKRDLNTEVIGKFLGFFTTSIDPAKKYLEKLTKPGFLSVVFMEKRLVQVLQSIDNDIVAMVSDMSLELNLTQLRLPQAELSSDLKVEEWLISNGGINAALNNQLRLNFLAHKLECTLADLTEELRGYLQRCGPQRRDDAQQLQQLEAQLRSQWRTVGSNAAYTFHEINVRRLAINKDTTLGEGSFGTVYGGEYQGEKVAVKTLKRNQILDNSKIQALRNEVELMHMFGQHPNFVRLIGANLKQYAGELCIVLEQADGSLEDALYETNALLMDLTLLTKMSIAVDIARAMAVLARSDVLFRDLKPGNVLIFLRGQRVVAKLTDFGFARRRSDRSSMISIKGTMAYMAPELLTSTPPAYSSMSEVYALGILLNELLLEEKPFHELKHANVNAFAQDIGLRNRRPRLFTSSNCFCEPIGQELEVLIQHCLTREPQQRPRCETVVERIQSVLDAVGTLVHHGQSGCNVQATNSTPVEAIAAAAAAATATAATATAADAPFLNLLGFPTMDEIIGRPVRIMALQNIEDLAMIQFARSGIAEGMSQLLGQRGTLLCVDADGDVQVRVGGVEFYWSPELVLLLRENSDEAWMSVAALQTLLDEPTAISLDKGKKVTILKTSEKDARELMKSDDDTDERDELTEEMMEAMGETGVVQFLYPNGDVRVRLVRLDVTYTWCRSLITTCVGVDQSARSTVCTPYCPNRHCMDQQRANSVHASLQCSLCRGPVLSNRIRNCNFFHCIRCSTNLCSACSTARIGSSVIIRQECTVEDMRKLQKGHGGFKPDMEKTRGMQGTIIDIDKDGDIAVVLKPTRNLSSTGFYYHPYLVMIDGSAPGMAVGSIIRVKDITRDFTRQKMTKLQKDVLLPFPQEQQSLVGKTGKICGIFRMTDHLVAAKVRFPDSIKDYLWNLDLLEILPKESTSVVSAQTNPSATTISAVSSLTAAVAASSISDDGDDVSTTPALPPARRFKAGMTVKIRSFSKDEVIDAQLSHGGMHPEMLSMSSKIGRLIRVDRDSDDLYVNVEGKVFCWNPYLVEPVKTTKFHVGEFHSGSKKWSCCHRVERESEGCRPLFHWLLPPSSVGSLVRIRRVTKDKLLLLHGPHVDVEQMTAQIGKIGVVQRFDRSSGQMFVEIENQHMWWHPSLVENVTSHVLIPQCSSKFTHKMKMWCGRPTVCPASEALTCKVCSRAELQEDDVLFYCQTCKVSLCTLCSASTPSKPVFVQNFNRARLETLQAHHGGYLNNMENDICGNIGTLSKTNDQGDVEVRFGKTLTYTLSSSPELTLLQTSGLPCLRPGMLVRIHKPISEVDVQRLLRLRVSRSEIEKLVGRVCTVNTYTYWKKFQLCYGNRNTRFDWLPQLVTRTNGVDDLEQFVRIVDETEDTIKELQKLIGCYEEGMEIYSNRIGDVVDTKSDMNYSKVHIRIGDKLFWWNSLLVMKITETEIKVRIKNVHVRVGREKQRGIEELNDMMAMQFGKTGRAVNIDHRPEGGIQVDIDGSIFRWSWEMVEIVSPANFDDVVILAAKIFNRPKGLFRNAEVQIKVCTLEEARNNGVTPAMGRLMGRKGKVINPPATPTSVVQVEIEGTRSYWSPAMLEVVDTYEALLRDILQQMMKVY